MKHSRNSRFLIKGVLRNCANKDATGKPPDRRNGYDKLWLEYLQMELGVHTWWFCGGHDPSLLAKYELRTPTENIGIAYFGNIFSLS